MSQPNPNDSFFGGAPTLSYPKANNGTYTDRALLGKVRGGRIVDEPQLQQMTDMVSGAPQFWDQAHTRPKMQLVVTLLCDGSGEPMPGVRSMDERQNPQDNGQRRLYIRGKDMTDAVRNAFTEAGSPGLRVGGELYVVWTGERPSKMKGGDPARTWASKYIPGTVGIPAQSAAEARQGQPVTTPNYSQPPPNGALNPYAAAQPTAGYPGADDPWGAATPPPDAFAPQGAVQPPQPPFGGQPQTGPADMNPFA